MKAQENESLLRIIRLWSTISILKTRLRILFLLLATPVKPRGLFFNKVRSLNTFLFYITPCWEYMNAFLPCLVAKGRAVIKMKQFNVLLFLSMKITSRNAFLLLAFIYSGDWTLTFRFLRYNSQNIRKRSRRQYSFTYQNV